MTAIGQTIVSGVLLGGIYALFSLGMTLSWALLRVINYAMFGFVFLAAYLTYDLATFRGLDPLVTVLVTVPLGIATMCALQALTSVARIDTFGSLIVTFGLFLVVESGITLVWSNDIVRIPIAQNPYFVKAWHVGAVTVPILHMLTLACAVLMCLGSYLLLQRTFTGKAMRASVQDEEIAAAFGVNSSRLGYLVAGTCGAAIALAGSAIGMMFVLTPTDSQGWVPVVFAVVLLGGLGNPVGLLYSSMILALIESGIQRFADPSMAKLAPLLLLVVVVLFRPQGLFRPAVERQVR